MSNPQLSPRDELRAQMRAALDARALNLQQQRLIRNPSPQVDSIVEVVHRMIADGPEPRWVLELSRLVKQLEQGNQMEGEQERALARGIEQSLQRHFGSKKQTEVVA